MSTPQSPKGLSRGEFARASGLSPKALRLYERSGLLVPHRVGAGGHRIYLGAQVERARSIRLLRQMDMPLAVVAQVMAQERGQALERAEAWWRAQEEALRSRRGALAELRLSWGEALRERGVAARTRVGFASYLHEGFWTDHVVSEYWDGGRWVWADTQLDPAGPWPVDVLDIPRAPGARGGVFASAAQVWLAHRAGEVDADRYGVHPDLPLRGAGFVRAYVLLELAHRQGEELLLWDIWGAMGAEDDGVFDEVARLLVAADAGDGAAERELAAWYARDGRLNPGGRVLCHSPSGFVGWVDLERRTVEPG